MKSTDTLGHFEVLVLTAVLALRDQAYGKRVHLTVNELAGKEVQLPAIYITLDRLEEQGYVTSWMTEARPERGGRPRRCYKLVEAGERALIDSRNTAKRVHETVDKSWRFLKWKPARAKA